MGTSPRRIPHTPDRLHHPQNAHKGRLYCVWEIGVVEPLRCLSDKRCPTFADFTRPSLNSAQAPSIVRAPLVYAPGAYSHVGSRRASLPDLLEEMPSRPPRYSRRHFIVARSAFLRRGSCGNYVHRTGCECSDVPRAHASRHMIPLPTSRSLARATHRYTWWKKREYAIL
jgi:hypothetical protein